ncbi:MULTISPECIES: hypothetical protein [unclassified Shewanella]|uniref:hypothetical protein n=1 Tax=unclassified Shewanella TaxID=196818 RepID=UPI001F0578B0|nr:MULTISPECIES: hypothetical protein [unclassified Shewanella]
MFFNNLKTTVTVDGASRTLKHQYDGFYGHPNALEYPNGSTLPLYQDSPITITAISSRPAMLLQVMYIVTSQPWMKRAISRALTLLTG